MKISGSASLLTRGCTICGMGHQQLIRRIGTPTLQLNNSIIANNMWYGLHANGLVTVINNIIENNGTDGIVSGGTDLTITDNVIRFNGSNGIYFANSLGDATAVNISHNTIYSNTGRGVFIGGRKV